MNHAVSVVSLVFGTLLGGCAASRPALPHLDTPFPVRGQSSATYPTADERVGVYVSQGWGFHTRSYWIEGPDGLILVDTQFMPSAALEAVHAAEAATGKRVVLAVVLHANPDKFNGTAVLQQRGIKVVTSQPVKELIPAVHKKRLAAFYDRYKPDYPRAVPQPEGFEEQTTELEAGGLKVKVHVLGAGCSDAHVALQFEEHLFVGDLVANGAHAWLELARVEAWQTRLEELRALKPRFVHPGRGASGGPDLLVRQADYIRQVSTMVAAESPSGPPKKDALVRIREKIVARYPKYAYPVFLRIGLPAEWRRQAAFR